MVSWVSYERRQSVWYWPHHLLRVFKKYWRITCQKAGKLSFLKKILFCLLLSLVHRLILLTLCVCVCEWERTNTILLCLSDDASIHLMSWAHPAVTQSLCIDMLQMKVDRYWCWCVKGSTTTFSRLWLHEMVQPAATPSKKLSKTYLFSDGPQDQGQWKYAWLTSGNLWQPSGGWTVVLTCLLIVGECTKTQTWLVAGLGTG